MHVPTFSPVVLCPQLLDEYCNMTLSIYVIYMQNVLFFHTILQKLKFCTFSVISNKNKTTKLSKTQLVLSLYCNRGFNIIGIHADMAFDCIKYDCLPTMFD